MAKKLVWQCHHQKNETYLGKQCDVFLYLYARD